MNIFHIIFDRVFYNILYSAKYKEPIWLHYFRLWGILFISFYFITLIPWLCYVKDGGVFANSSYASISFCALLFASALLCYFLKKRNFIESIIERYNDFTDTYKKEHHAEWIWKGMLPFVLFFVIIALLLFLLGWVGLI